MIKLIKKNGLGGIANSVDSALNGLGTWGKLVQIIDPTGITSWKDFGDSLKAFQKEGTLLKAGEMSLSALGVIPMFGVFKGLPKLFGIAKKVDKASDSAKLIKKVADLPAGITVKEYKELLDLKNVGEIISGLDMHGLNKLRSCVESSASQFIKSTKDAASSPEAIARAKNYEKLLSEIDDAADAIYNQADDILVTNAHSFDVMDGKAVMGERSYNINTKKGRTKAEKAQKAKGQFLQNNPVIYFS